MFFPSQEINILGRAWRPLVKRIKSELTRSEILKGLGFEVSGKKTKGRLRNLTAETMGVDPATTGGPAGTAYSRAQLPLRHTAKFPSAGPQEGLNACKRTQTASKTYRHSRKSGGSTHAWKGNTTHTETHHQGKSGNTPVK